MLLLPFLFARAVGAIPKIPQATAIDIDGHDYLGWSPAPTIAPNLELRHLKLLGRQELTDGEFVGYLAQDNTCGYLSGSSDLPLYCATTELCAALNSQYIGCCPTVGPETGCTWLGTCYNYDDIASSICDESCQLDTLNNVLCSFTDAPYCQGYTAPDIDATFWGCDSTSASSDEVATFLTDYAGQTDAPTWEPVYYTASDSSSIIIVPSSTTDPSPPPTSTSPVPPTQSSGPPIGAIVGGVIGGVAVLALIIGGAIFLRRKKTNKPETPVPQTAPMAQAPQSPQSPPPGYHGGAAGSPQHTSPGGSYYASPMSPGGEYPFQPQGPLEGRYGQGYGQGQQGVYTKQNQSPPPVELGGSPGYGR